MSHLQLRQLLYLKTVAETNSIRKASDTLFVSQQAVSQALRALEQEYSVQLLERSVHGVSLTPAGEHVVRLGEDVLTRVEEIERYLKSCRTQPAEQTLRICAPSFCINYVLPKPKVQLMRQYPDAAIEIRPAEWMETIEAVSLGQCDIGFLSVISIDGKPLDDIPPQFTFTTLYDYRYTVMVSSNSPLNRYETLTLKSVLQYPIIFFAPEILCGLEEYELYRMLAHYGPVNARIAENQSTFVELLRNNMGVAINSDHNFARFPSPSSISTKPLRDHATAQLGYIIGPNCSPLAKEFLKFLKEGASNNLNETN